MLFGLCFFEPPLIAMIAMSTDDVPCVAFGYAGLAWALRMGWVLRLTTQLGMKLRRAQQEAQEGLRSQDAGELRGVGFGVDRVVGSRGKPLSYGMGGSGFWSGWGVEGVLPLFFRLWRNCETSPLLGGWGEIGI